MNRNGPVIIIDDDIDDRDLYQEIFTNLGYPNRLIFFEDGEKALDYLSNISEVPFLIISDINMPKLTGMELRQKLKTDAALQLRCIPYLFFTTAVSQAAVVDAYSASAQGFFVKQASVDEMQKSISVIVEYWKRCVSPNNF